MDSKQRIQNIINKLEEIIENDYINVILSEKDLRIIELLLGIKPYSKKVKEVKRISGRGLVKRKKSCN